MPDAVRDVRKYMRKREIPRLSKSETDKISRQRLYLAYKQNERDYQAFLDAIERDRH